jgi:hypothetical protein
MTQTLAQAVQAYRTSQDDTDPSEQHRLTEDVRRALTESKLPTDFRTVEDDDEDGIFVTFPDESYLNVKPTGAWWHHEAEGQLIAKSE